MNLDKADLQLLALLQENSDYCHKELSFKLHKSIAAVYERIRKLKNKGFIKCTVAIVYFGEVDHLIRWRS